MLIIYLYLFGVVFFEEGTKNSDSFFLSLSLSLNGDVVGVKRRGREREASSSIDGVL